MRSLFALLVVLVLFILNTFACNSAECDEYLTRIRLPEGFEIEYYVKHAQGARSLFLSPASILYIGTRDEGDGNVYAALDRDGDGVAEEVIVIITGLTLPNGIAFKDGSLYVVEMTKIHRFDRIDQLLLQTGVPPQPILVRDDLPVHLQGHGWRYASFNSANPSDPYLYIAIGADCNICEVDGLFGTIVKVDLTSPTSQYEVVAHGVRNSVGFNWHPTTQEFWFTENGRDGWGNDRPGDELNRVVLNQEGLHYGFPYCYEEDLVDPTYNQQGNCDKYVGSSQVLGPHVAALGMLFYTGANFPQDYLLDAFICEHGSWNREIPIGFRVTRVEMNQDGTGPVGEGAYTVFADGWLPDGASQGSEAFGRPVDTKIMKDGSLLVSDDRNNAVYRIYYTGNKDSSFFSLSNSQLIIIGCCLFFASIVLLVANLIYSRAKNTQTQSEDRQRLLDMSEIDH